MLELVNISYQNQLQCLSTTFSTGKIYGILGPNGAGKTTLLKSISGIWPLSAGQILYNHVNYLKKERREISRLVSYVSQSPVLSFDFSVYDIVSMSNYCHSKMINHSHRKMKIEWALNKVDCWHLRSKKITQLSSGEKQRVFIARALAMDTQIILLDEPTSCLDIRHQMDVWDLLKNLKEKIVIVATHDIRSAINYCDELILIKNGSLVAQGAPKTLLTVETFTDVFGLQKHHLENMGLKLEIAN